MNNQDLQREWKNFTDQKFTTYNSKEKNTSFLQCTGISNFTFLSKGRWWVDGGKIYYGLLNHQ